MLSSCWSTQYIPLQDEYNNEWKGASKKEIILKWGIPDKVLDLEDNESVLVYENTILNQSINGKVGESSFEVESVTSGTKSNRQYKEFYLDNNKNCYAVRTNEVREIRQSEPVRTGILIGGIATGVTLTTILGILSHKK